MARIGINNTTTQLQEWLVSLPRRGKQFLMICGDVWGFAVCILFAAWLASIPGLQPPHASILLTIALIVTIVAEARAGYFHSVVRYLGLGLAWASVKIVALSSAAVFLAVSYLAGVVESLRFALTFGVLYLIYLVGSRYLVQYVLARKRYGREPVVLFGAGEAGARTTQSLQKANTFIPVALIDDDETLHGRIISGVRVHGRGDIDQLLAKHGVSKVLLAMPGIPRRSRQEIIRWLEEKNIHVQTIPGMDDLVTGRAKFDDIQEIDVADLLGRAAVPPEVDLLEATITGKTVMVTGAGGSIGAELCRQIIGLHAARLVLFELSEPALYAIEKDLRKLAATLDPDLELIALLGSVQNAARLQEAMQTFGVQTVYHVAAYKHVPMVEQNLLEGISNNVFGTLHAAQAAEVSKVETFVLISTDKAVHPANAMGATKRIAEMILQALQAAGSPVRFCMVRFGNVLASSGSVVPLFREQIRAGGPVTVTHREIIRYFMTIPEAAQLVIQAASMAEGGDVFVLDMGEPVRIRDLARRMVHLMGLTVRDADNPQGDIEIRYTGLRPAEKLYEELLLGSNVSGTAHPQILRASEEHLSPDRLMLVLDHLRDALRRGDREASRKLLLECVKGYAPSNDIDDLVWVGQQAGVISKAPNKLN